MRQKSYVAVATAVYIPSVNSHDTRICEGVVDARCAFMDVAIGEITVAASNMMLDPCTPRSPSKDWTVVLNAYSQVSPWVHNRG
ncbi:hypothetical protein P692DRAFT_20566346 [Suillus brevipes Sb2]|jgi:hypothetical protein|nr:hypothetical protein P692DRAFT_20566346 [Suillus brevipes Sb2]